MGSLALMTPAFTGHYAIIGYGTQMFKAVGFESAQGANLTIIFQTVKLIVTLPDFLWLDAFPRRALMRIGLLGMAGCYSVAMIALPLHLPTLAAFALLASAA